MGKRWTDEDDKWMHWWWGVDKLTTIAKRLGRTDQAVQKRARKMGLAGVPSGWALVCDIASESGFDTRTACKILVKMQVQIRTKWRCRKSKNGPTVLIVDRERAERAIHKWLAWETPVDAANRLNLAASAVRSAVKRSFGDMGRVPGGRLRLPPETYDAACEGIAPRTKRGRRSARIKGIENGSQQETKVQP